MTKDERIMGSAIICFVLSGLSLLGTLAVVMSDVAIVWKTLWISNGIISTIVCFLGGTVFLWLQRIHAAIEGKTESVLIRLDSINRNGNALNAKLGVVIPPEPLPTRRKPVVEAEEAIPAPAAMFKRTRLS